MSTYRLTLRFERPDQEATCLADEPAAIGSLFYGQWGRAVVLKCTKTDAAQTKTCLQGTSSTPQPTERWLRLQSLRRQA